MGFEMPAEFCRPETSDAAVSILANVISCVLDEALLARVGTFEWSLPAADLPSPAAVPVNRYDRAATHLWHMVFGKPGLVVPDEDVERLYFLLKDALKSASRCHAGDVRELMNESVWHQLVSRLSDYLQKSGHALAPWQK